MNCQRIRLAALSVAVFGLGSTVLGQAAPPLFQQPPAQQPVMQPPPAQDAATSRWPVQLTTSDGGSLTIFQPQLEDFSGNQMRTRAAVAISTPGQDQPIFGVIWLQNTLNVNQAAGTVQVVDIQVTSSRFPNPDAISTDALNIGVRDALMGQPMILSLDQVQAALATVQQENAAAATVQNVVPTIVVRDHPTVKVQYDGPPRLVQDAASGIFRVMNTPFFVGLDGPSRTYFLKGAGLWFSAPDPMGPFALATTIPASIVELAMSSGYADPQQPMPPDQAARLEILTATDPTELVWTDGPMQLGTIPGTGLLYAANSDSDYFLDIDNQQRFVLISGRWYSTTNPNGPWAYVPPTQLPPDFARIPPTSPKVDVLASVAGTAAAQDAVADSYLPQTAAIDRSQFQQPTIVFDGNPDFQPIQGTTLAYAVNTGSSIILANGQYYCCDNGVWFQAGAPVGPWGLCASVPSEVYLIPPSCPIYPVRYCTIYGVTPNVIYYGYTAGYVGEYRHDGVVIFGTGYNYHPWVGQVYIARPETFGFAARYDSRSSSWGFGVGLGLGGELWVAGASGPSAHHGDWFGYGGFQRDDRHIDSRPPPAWEMRRGAPAPPPHPEIHHGPVPVYVHRTDAKPLPPPPPPRGGENGGRGRATLPPLVHPPTPGNRGGNPGGPTPPRGESNPPRGNEPTPRGGGATPNPRTGEVTPRGGEATPTPPRGNEPTPRGSEPTPRAGETTPNPRGGESNPRGTPPNPRGGDVTPPPTTPRGNEPAPRGGDAAPTPRAGDATPTPPRGGDSQNPPERRGGGGGGQAGPGDNQGGGGAGGGRRGNQNPPDQRGGGGGGDQGGAGNAQPNGNQNQGGGGRRGNQNPPDPRGGGDQGSAGNPQPGGNADQGGGGGGGRRGNQNPGRAQSQPSNGGR